MTQLLSRLRKDDGQVLVLVAAIMVALIGMTAFVVDVGSWFRQQRATQSTVDAAALAGAQALPTDPSNALVIAKDYGAKNGSAGELTDADIKILSTYDANDTIKVSKKKAADSFFGKIFGVDLVHVDATATAMVGAPSKAQYVAPIGVNILHPDISGKDCGQDTLPREDRPCFGSSYETTLPLGKTGAPGAFDLIDLSGQGNGAVGESTLASWIRNGYDKYLPIGGYDSDPGAKFNGSDVQNALDARQGTELLFPVYDTLVGTGSNATYNVVGWIGFYLESGSLRGNSGSLTGYFTRVIWDGVLPATGGDGSTNFGDTTVALVN
jgi:Flp pilus assembly protein TadG